MATSPLPPGWARVRLGEVTKTPKRAVSQSDFTGQNYIGLENIERDTHRLVGLGDSSKITSVKSSFRAGDLLYGRLRPNLNKVLIPDFDGICSTDIVVFQSTSLLDNRYLLQILSEDDFLAYAASKAKGVNLPRLSLSDLLDYEIALPSLEEQLEILAVLEARLAQLEATRQRFVSFEETLQSLPSRIISRALSTKRPSVRSSDVSVATDETAAWPTKALKSVGEITLGKKRSQVNHQGSNMRPYLRVANVLEARIDTSDIMSMHFEPREFETYCLRGGDILINEGQSFDLVGRPAIFRDEIEGCCFTNTLIRFRAGPEVDADFALLVFRHYLHTGVFSAAAKITTNLAHLGLARFSELPFPLPGLSEQHDIARWATSRLNEVEELSRNIGRLGRMATRLDMAMRRHALAGSLAQGSGSIDVSERVRAARMSDVDIEVSVPRPQKLERGVKAVPISIREALEQTSSHLTGQELFERAGYPEDSSTETIERFFLELRDGLAAGIVLRTEDQGEDRFQLGHAEAGK